MQLQTLLYYSYMRDFMFITVFKIQKLYIYAELAPIPPSLRATQSINETN